MLKVQFYQTTVIHSWASLFSLFLFLFLSLSLSLSLCFCLCLSLSLSLSISFSLSLISVLAMDETSNVSTSKKQSRLKNTAAIVCMLPTLPSKPIFLPQIPSNLHLSLWRDTFLRLILRYPDKFHRKASALPCAPKGKKILDDRGHRSTCSNYTSSSIFVSFRNGIAFTDFVHVSLLPKSK